MPSSCQIQNRNRRGHVEFASARFRWKAPASPAFVGLSSSGLAQLRPKALGPDGDGTRKAKQHAFLVLHVATSRRRYPLSHLAFVGPNQRGLVRVGFARLTESN